VRDRQFSRGQPERNDRAPDAADSDGDNQIAITAQPSLGAGHARVGLGLIGLQAGADVISNVDVGNVD
jgi:hypothetical protein